jgi:hypothetical protein
VLVIEILPPACVHKVLSILARLLGLCAKELSSLVKLHDALRKLSRIRLDEKRDSGAWFTLSSYISTWMFNELYTCAADFEVDDMLWPTGLATLHAVCTYMVEALRNVRRWLKKVKQGVVQIGDTANQVRSLCSILCSGL